MAELEGGNEKAKGKLGAMANQYTLSVEIRYRLAMESFKKEAKKRGPSKYYYSILDIFIIPPYKPIQSQEGDDEEDSDLSESDDDTEVTGTWGEARSCCIKVFSFCCELDATFCLCGCGLDHISFCF